MVIPSIINARFELCVCVFFNTVFSIQNMQNTKVQNKCRLWITPCGKSLGVEREVTNFIHITLAAVSALGIQSVVL